MPKLTKAEFEEQYAQRFSINLGWLRKNKKVYPCQCGASDCPGWFVPEKTLIDVPGLVSMSKEELAKASGLSDEEIIEALAEGRKERDAFEASIHNKGRYNANS